MTATKSLLVNVTLTLAALLLNFGCSHDEDFVPTVRLSIRRFQSCEAIDRYAQEIQDRWDRANRHRGGEAMLSSGSAPSADQGSLNLQEVGVDEADYVRVNQSQIYYARPRSIEVVNRASLGFVGTLKAETLTNVRLIGERDTLIVLGNRASEGSTEVRFYQTAAAGALPNLAATHILKGRFTDARLVDGRLALILQGSYVSYDSKHVRDNELFSQIPCEGVPEPFVGDLDFSSTRVVTLNARQPAEAAKSELVPGAGDIQYMTKDAVYLVKQYWAGYRGRSNVTIVSKVTFSAETGEVKLVAAGGIRGTVKDRWALKEWADIRGVSLATTYDHSGERYNALVVLEQNGESLDIHGLLSSFGKHEDVRAVRYVDKIAYVVTFEKTDPLFTIDLSDLGKPKMVSELVLPGFSTYLHPVGAGRLLGLGFDAEDAGSFSWAQGIQLSLFDVSNALDPRRVDVKILGERGTSSEATHDAHAFYYDPAERIAAFPLSMHSPRTTTQYPTGTTTDFAGAIAFRVGNSLSEVARITHTRWAPPECQTSNWQFWASASRSYDVSRLLRVDGRLLGISNFGITAHDPADPSLERAATKFPPLSANLVCPSPYGYRL